MHHKHRYSLALLVALLLPYTVSADIELRFGIYATDRASTLVKKFRPVLSMLEADVGKKINETVNIKLIVTKTYEAAVKNLVEGKVDFSRFGPASYVIAKTEAPSLSILALESKKGKKVFYGVICVAEDSDIKTLSDLNGRSFAFGNQSSTIGRFLSQQVLSRAGIKASDLSKYDYLQRHDRVGLAVAAGKYDAGALKGSTFKKLVKEGKPIRSIKSFENMTKPWIVNDAVPERIKLALSEALLDLKHKKFHFVEGKDDDFEIIRQSINNNQNFFD